MGYMGRGRSAGSRFCARQSAPVRSSMFQVQKCANGQSDWIRPLRQNEPEEKEPQMTQMTQIQKLPNEPMRWERSSKFQVRRPPFGQFLHAMKSNAQGMPGAVGTPRPTRVWRMTTRRNDPSAQGRERCPQRAGTATDAFDFHRGVHLQEASFAGPAKLPNEAIARRAVQSFRFKVQSSKKLRNEPIPITPCLSHPTGEGAASGPAMRNLPNEPTIWIAD
jgi:hypothetical protein